MLLFEKLKPKLKSEIKIEDKFANIFIPFEIIQIPKKVKTIRFDSQGNPINEQ